jgi:hypothetical protein
MITSWVPGGPVDPGAYSDPGTYNDGAHSDSYSSSYRAGVIFYMVGLPLIILAVIATCLGCWCHRRRQRRRRVEKCIAVKAAAGEEGGKGGKGTETERKGVRAEREVVKELGSTTQEGIGAG